LCVDDNTKAWAQAFENNLPSEGHDDNDLLLAPRVLGYALGRKTWCQFLLSHICVTEFSEGDTGENRIIFPDQFPEDEQLDVLRTVQNHHGRMAKPVHQRLSDQIGSKGDSLILLFHGKRPRHRRWGTNQLTKTRRLHWYGENALCRMAVQSVQEAVVQSWNQRHRPGGQWGGEKSEADIRTCRRMESYLTDVSIPIGATGLLLTLASRDEADVLLDARGKANEGSHKKNALVSGKVLPAIIAGNADLIVLLREVEYFKGILILTTNRVSAFDAAVLSRLHHAINFGIVTKSQEEQIWRMWFEKAKKLGLVRQPDEVERWISSLNKKRSIYLNGREIRNIFLIAQDLHEDGLIRWDDLKRIYDWKICFRDETNKQTISADQLLAPCR
jgi:hypothetical protein